MKTKVVMGFVLLVLAVNSVVDTAAATNYARWSGSICDHGNDNYVLLTRGSAPKIGSTLVFVSDSINLVQCDKALSGSVKVTVTETREWTNGGLWIYGSSN
jgi:hypothetical protein